MKLRKINLILIPILIAAICGCSDVKPWQKEFLAKQNMAFDPDPLTARSRQHMYTSKEASFGGSGVGGGGCGCN